MYLSLYCKGLKRCGVLLWEGVGDRTETEIFWPSLLWPSALCLSHSPGLLNRKPRAHSAEWSATSYQQLPWTPTHQGPQGPKAWCGFPYQLSSITPSDLQLALIRGPKAWCGFPYQLSSITPSDLQLALIRGPQGLMWLSLPTLVYNSVRSPTGTQSGAPRPDVALPTNSRLSLTVILTELYNSSTPTQSPTRSLESHV